MGELIEAGRRKVGKEAALREAAARQLVPGERVVADVSLGGEQVTVTDRRLVITKVGALLGERAESVMLGSISALATHTQDGRIIALQLAVPGRTWGELALAGEDLGPIYAAIVASQANQGSVR